MTEELSIKLGHKKVQASLEIQGRKAL